MLQLENQVFGGFKDFNNAILQPSITLIKEETPIRANVHITPQKRIQFNLNLESAAVSKHTNTLNVISGRFLGYSSQELPPFSCGGETFTNEEMGNLIPCLIIKINQKLTELNIDFNLKDMVKRFNTDFRDEDHGKAVHHYCDQWLSQFILNYNKGGQYDYNKSKFGT